MQQIDLKLKSPKSQFCILPLSVEIATRVILQITATCFTRALGNDMSLSIF